MSTFEHDSMVESHCAPYTIYFLEELWLYIVQICVDSSLSKWVYQSLIIVCPVLYAYTKLNLCLTCVTCASGN